MAVTRRYTASLIAGPKKCKINPFSLVFEVVLMWSAKALRSRQFIEAHNEKSMGHEARPFATLHPNFDNKLTAI